MEKILLIEVKHCKQEGNYDWNTCYEKYRLKEDDYLHPCNCSCNPCEFLQTQPKGLKASYEFVRGYGSWTRDKAWNE